ncbi:damage-inducible protein DinB [Paenibacillus ihbetae]|uniref:Damage-inducible protein DinB n=1 Tax=Paenibacillus ihbetae TaxID=1870820 RepID=A0A1B2E5N8_9BACL|nr:DinB family protein [Paenibacillus ihbetae]ANY75279.1 damage-inducible protein DinB [Paenibacillus ihbetae]
MNKQLVQLYDYNVWANERVMDHLDTLPGEVFLREVDLGFKSIAEVISHVVSADNIWFNRIKEEQDSIPAKKVFTDLKEARQEMDELQSQIRDYVSSLSDTEKKVSYTMASGRQMENSIAEILQQVVNHGTYHRGNITTMLRSFGYQGVMTDYIAFLMK